jgi:hypothetical protein
MMNLRTPKGRTYLLLFACFVLFEYTSLKPPGYCSSEERQTVDIEFRRATFNLLIMQRNLVLNIHTLGGSTRYGVRPFDEKYSKWSPLFNFENCCVVERHDSLWRRLFGLEEVYVIVNPKAPEPSDDWLTFRYNVCGYLKGSDAGVPSAEIHDIKTTHQGMQDVRHDFKIDAAQRSIGN